MEHQAHKLYKYHVWANRKVIDHLKELPEDFYEKEIQSVFSSVSEVMYHILIVDHIWLGVLLGDPFDQIMSSVNRLTEETKEMAFEAMEVRFHQLSEEYENFLSRQEDLDRPLTIEHPSYGRLDASLAQLVQHVVNHGTYHRGNISAMLHQLGHRGIPTDYVFYLYTLNKS
ncbi:DinB family protein [Alkalihalobacillus sp. AL-G]|uniref:DinB family protein n=1 Tax=Alkalihalobacillus sp. AL-G TaxID=2926399 RepID=UPI00272C9DE1|nr:DinB family protein [Alkalihalobacillus sp. AL-G]WLD93933.1 DinB family protein [Alkalihalobacillus sp. AL-G]